MRAKREVDVPATAAVAFKGFSLYFIRLELGQLSRENMLLDPFGFEVVPRFR